MATAGLPPPPAPDERVQVVHRVSIPNCHLQGAATQKLGLSLSFVSLDGSCAYLPRLAPPSTELELSVRVPDKLVADIIGDAGTILPRNAGVAFVTIDAHNGGGVPSRLNNCECRREDVCRWWWG